MHLFVVGLSQSRTSAQHQRSRSKNVSGSQYSLSIIRNVDRADFLHVPELFGNFNFGGINCHHSFKLIL